MLSKDKLFDINEFIRKNNSNKLFEVSDVFVDISSDLVKSTQQQSIVNKFLMKNGYKNVAEVEKSIYNMFQEVIKCADVVEAAQVS
jgi:hypothetical protein